MRALTHCLTLIALVLFVGNIDVMQGASATTSFPTDPKEHSSFSGDLVSALTYIGQTFDVSIVAEVAQPYPTQLRLPAGKHTAEELLTLLVQQAAGYAWQKQGSVAWVYNQEVAHSTGDFLNLHRTAVRMPGNLGELRLQLPMEVSVAEGHGGGVGTGVVPREHEEFHLSPETLANPTIRDVLFRAATEVKLLSVIVFPNSSPTPSDQDEAFSNWYLVPNELLSSQPLHVRSLPAKHNFGPSHLP